jgi:hypothetical protein
VGSKVVVNVAPFIDDFPGMVDREEDVLVQTLFTELAVERFNKCILLRFARLNEIDLNFFMCPSLEGAGPELWAVVASNDSRNPVELIEELC